MSQLVAFDRDAATPEVLAGAPDYQRPEGWRQDLGDGELDRPLVVRAHKFSVR